MNSDILYDKPWLITPAGFAAMIRAAEDFDESPIEPKPTKAYAYGTDAIIDVQGPIGYKLDDIDKEWFGMVDTRDIDAAMQAALADDMYERIILNIDSPGGTVSGTVNLANSILGSRGEKPIIAFSDGLMASAAYWIGASADSIYATPDAEVGSIGVYLPVLDVSGMYEQAGAKVEVFKSGDLKAAGLPGTSLNDAQRQNLQGIVDSIYGLFTSHVRTTRGRIDDDTMRGQTFLAEEAKTRGLIDGIKPNIETI